MSNGYSNIPNELLDWSLSSDAMKLLLYLYTRPPKWKVWNVKITSDTGLTKNRIAKSFKELIDKELVSRDRERYKNGAIKGGGYVYKINCIPENEHTGKTENVNTVENSDISVAFEEIWKSHSEYRKQYGNTNHGSKAKSKKLFFKLIKDIEKKIEIEDYNELFCYIDDKISSLRNGKYTNYLQNILDVETIMDGHI